MRTSEEKGLISKSPLLLNLRLMFPDPEKYCRSFLISFFWLFRVFGHTFGTHVVGIKRVTQFIASCWNLFNIEQFPNFKYIPQVSGRFPNFLVPDENFDFNQRQIEFTNIAVFLHTRTFSTKQMYKASCEHYVTAKKMWKNLHDNENERRRRHIFVANVARPIVLFINQGEQTGTWAPCQKIFG